MAAAAAIAAAAEQKDCGWMRVGKVAKKPKLVRHGRATDGAVPLLFALLALLGWLCSGVRFLSLRGCLEYS